jgi:hypothetical protein
MDASAFTVILACSVFALGPAIEWVRAARQPSRRFQAIWATAGELAFFALLLSNVGGLGASFAFAITTVFALLYARILWAATVLVGLVILGIEVRRLARARDSEGRP